MVVLLAVLARAVTASRLQRFARELVALYWDSGVANDIPALAWFLLSSLVPLALGITALAAVALGDYAKAQALSVRISNVLPKDIHDQLVTLILRTKEQSPLLIAASIIGMVWVSSGAVGVIERCLLRLLARPSEGVVRGKLRNLGLAAVVTVVIMLMVAVATAGTDLVARLNVNPTAIRLAVPLISLALTTLLCGAVFRALAGESLQARSLTCLPRWTNSTSDGWRSADASTPAGDERGSGDLVGRWDPSPARRPERDVVLRVLDNGERDSLSLPATRAGPAVVLA